VITFRVKAPKASKSPDEIMDEAMALALERTIARVRTFWPEDTGYSLSRFRFLRVKSGHYRLINDARYSSFVHRKGESQPLVDRFRVIIREELNRAIAELDRAFTESIEAMAFEGFGDG